MFWRYNLITGSSIETLLDKENVTLKELMDEEDILQECKAQTKKLLDFMVKPEILENTVTMIISEPDPEEDERKRYRYANRACEMLTFDNPQIYEALASDEGILKKLYAFLDTDEKLNPLLASFFSKTMGLLITKKTEVLYEFLKDRDFIPRLLKHFNTSAIMDLLLRFLTVENNEKRTAVIKWLDDEKLIQQLVSKIGEEEYGCNVSHALCDIIKMSREHMALMQEKADPNPLLDTIQSVEVISELLEQMLKDTKKEHAIVNGTAVLLTLLSFKKTGPPGFPQMPVLNSFGMLTSENAPMCFATLCKAGETEHLTSLDAQRIAVGVHNVLLAISPRLEDFHNLLLNPPPKAAMKLTIGCLDPPLGNCRLEIAHLITSLLSSNNHTVNSKLSELGTLVVLMEMFFKYPWNNFLHTQVEQALGRVFMNPPTVDVEGNKVHPLLEQMLLKYKITVKILECFQDDYEKFIPGVHRKGYMGHMTKIANHVAQNLGASANSNLIKEKLKELPEEHQKSWEDFMSNKLNEINKKNRVHPVSGSTMQSVSIDEDSCDFRDIPFGNETSERLAFSDYQMHEMTSNFVDQFGFNDDEFGDNEDSLIYAKSSINTMSQNFATVESNSMRSAEVFEEVCRNKVSSEGDAVLWADSQYNTKFTSCFGMNRSVEESNSSDSDEESQVFEAETSPSDDMKMDVDHHEAMFDAVPMEVAPEEGRRKEMMNPWESAVSSTTSEDQGGNWADFSNFATFGTPPATDQSEVSSTVSIAMETSETSSTKFFTNSSEISSTKDIDPMPSEINTLNMPPVEKKADPFLEASSSQVESTSETTPPCGISGDTAAAAAPKDATRPDDALLFFEDTSSAQTGPG